MTRREPADAGLAHERTVLARRRTALSVGVLSLAVARLAVARTPTRPAVCVGVCVLAALAMLSAATSSRPSLRPGLDTLLLSISTALLAGTAVLVVWLRG